MSIYNTIIESNVNTLKEMGKKETRFNLRIMVIITCIARIPLIDSTTVNSNKNVLSQLDGDDISGNHVDVCCFMVTY